jgi:zinc transporter 9
VDEVHGEQSQWVGPSSFSYKAEVDFDGTWLAAQLYERYEDVFIQAAMEGPDRVQQDLTWLLPAFAEDVTRVLEKEVSDIQKEVCLWEPFFFFFYEPSGPAETLRAIFVAPICFQPAHMASCLQHADHQESQGGDLH